MQGNALLACLDMFPFINIEDFCTLCNLMRIAGNDVQNIAGSDILVNNQSDISGDTRIALDRIETQTARLAGQDRIQIKFCVVDTAKVKLTGIFRMHFTKDAEEFAIQGNFSRAVWMEVNRIILVLTDAYSGSCEAIALQPCHQNTLQCIKGYRLFLPVQLVIPQHAIQHNRKSFLLFVFGIDFGKLIEVVVFGTMCFIVLHTFQHGIHQTGTDVGACFTHRHGKCNRLTCRKERIICICFGN